MKKILSIFVGLFLLVPCVSYGAKYSGTVKDRDGNVLMGATVLLRDGVGCTTGGDGWFRNCELGNGVVKVSYVGFKTKEVQLNNSGSTDIILDEDSQLLDSVVAVADDPAKKCKEKENGKWEQTADGGYTCQCPDGKKWNKRTEKCDVEIANLPSIGGGNGLPDKLEPRQSEDLNVSLCKGQNGEWIESKKTCKCPDGQAWEASVQKCEDADLVDVRNACFALKDAAQWDEDTHVCTCVNEKQTYEYNAKRKRGKCVDEKTEKPEPEQQSKPKPKERTDEEKAAALVDKKKAYDDAKANEFSDANKALTAATTLATGLGGMQLAQGYFEQQADKNAEEAMAGYLTTFHCTYGKGKFVNAGLEEVELPGGNDETFMKYRNEYLALAASLKERKESLNMKPGIESEVILDKADMGLYEQENIGITGGRYSSLYRANMLGSEADQAQIASDKEASANRVKYGAIVAGAGVAVGLIGNSLINGKLGELIKGAKGDKNSKEKEDKALKDLKQCMKDAGATNYNNLKFSKFTPSVLHLENINCKTDLNIKGKDATTLFVDSDDGGDVTKKLVESFGEKNAALLLGTDVTNVTDVSETVSYPGGGGEQEAQIVTPKGKLAAKMTRFDSDKDYGDGKGYCYNFIDGFVRGEIESSECSKLQAGDWMTYFTNGNVKGISVCSSIWPDNISPEDSTNRLHGYAPDDAQQNQIQSSYDNWVAQNRPKPSSEKKLGCYCKMNNEDGKKTKWVFDSYFSDSHCRSSCAYFCAYLVKEQDSFKEAVLKTY